MLIEEALVPAQGCDLFVRKAGAGPSLVLVHGGPGMSHEYLLPMEAVTDAGVRIVTYDQRGSGRSTIPDPPQYALRDHASDLDAVREHLEEDRIHVLGHSWGGLVAMSYAVRYPRRIASLTLVCSMAPFFEDNRSGQVELRERIAELTDLGIIPDPMPSNSGDSCKATSLAMLPAYLGDPEQPTPEPLLLTSFSISAYQRCVDRLGRYDLRNKLVDFVSPTTIYSGHLDPFGVDIARATARALSAAFPEVTVLPRVGHYPWLESDAFVDELRSLVRRRIRRD